MSENIIKAHGAHPFGLTWMARRDGAHADMLMDFGVMRMKKGDVYEENGDLEKAVLLVYGKVCFEWARIQPGKHPAGGPALRPDSGYKDHLSLRGSGDQYHADG